MTNVKTVLIDLETTGLVPDIRVPGKRPGTTKKAQMPYDTMFDQYPYILSMAWKVDDQETKYFVINQEGREVPKEASDINGITTEIANASLHTMKEVIKLFIVDAVGSDIVVGHNLYFDTSIIKANVLRCFGKSATFDFIEDILHKHKRIDTCRKTIKMMGKWPTLQELHMKIFRRGFEAHNAKNDVEALHGCYGWLVQKGIVPTLEQLKEKAIEKEQANGS